MFAKLLNRFIPPKSCENPLWLSDNMGGRDGEVVGHKSGEKLPPGTYWFRDTGRREIRRVKFTHSIP